MKNNSFYTSEWFDTEYYNMLYSKRDKKEAEEFIRCLFNFLKPHPDQTFLDIGCGEGRHVFAMAQYGVNITGIDMAQQKIQKAQQQNPYPATVKFIHGDIRTHPFSSSFHYITSLFTSLGYDDDDQNVLLFEKIYQLLHTNGLFILDYLNAQKVRENLVPYEKITHNNITFFIERYIKDQRVIKKITLHHGSQEKVFYENIRLYDKNELTQLLIHKGFFIKKMYGSYFLDEFHKDSDRLIIIAQK